MRAKYAFAVGPTPPATHRARLERDGLGSNRISHSSGTHAEAHFGRVDAVEIDQPLERRFERSAVVVAGRFEGAGGLQPRSGHAGREEARGAVRQDESRAKLVHQTAGDV